MLIKYLKRFKRWLLWCCRRLTASNRALPDIIIIGAMKAGTTSLYSYLSEHPQLIPSCRKEVHYFDGGVDSRVEEFEKGEGWYRAHFPLRKKIGVDQKVFEASPLYIFNPLVPKRMFDLLPDVKIIVVLRNPTDRAISHYFHERRKERESLSIENAIQCEEKRLEAVIKEKDYSNDEFIHHSYKKRGLYKEQLERYFQYFSQQQILIIKSEEFFAEPQKVLANVFRFVGVDDEYRVNDLRPRHVTKNRSDVAPEVYELLDDYFAGHNQALYDFVGKKYDW